MSYSPPSLLLQWHITDRCNLRCQHCYQHEYQSSGLPYEQMLGILDQFKNFLRQRSVRQKGHVTVTGGEPLSRQDCAPFLEELSQHKDLFSFAVLTNGTLLDQSWAERFARWQPAFVQISLDGGQATHDAIRGTGNFDRAVAAMTLLVEQDVRTFISFTAHKNNYHEFAEVARIGQKLRVARVWADRLIPETSEQRELSLSPEQTYEFLEIMSVQRQQAQKAGQVTEIAMHRALQFLVSDGSPYRCAAANTLITVMPDGTLYPCRRLPISVGNLLKTPLQELYDSELMRSLRQPEKCAKGCEACAFASVCAGGLRCLAYAVHRRTDCADPGCWIAQN
jgi:radical SAM protein with 4Fe4S-binding SPASM domain